MQSCSCFFPVYGVELSSALNRELRIERVLFIAGKRIPYVRKKLGISSPISFYKNKRNNIFENSSTYAVVKSRRNSADKDVTKERKCVQDALWILASSLSNHSRGRYELSLIPFLDGKLYESSLIFQHRGNEGYVNSSRMSPVEPYNLHTLWKQRTNRTFFWNLLKILNKKINVSRSWRKTLRRAAILRGQSFLANNVHDAFIRDMIAIETLLTSRGDSFPDALIDRIIAFFGWMTKDQSELWSNMVKRLYRLRCSYVHDGEAGEITGEDVYYADILLANILSNVCANPKTFKSKDDIIEFGQRLEARRTLGMRLRTKSIDLHFMGGFPSGKTLEKINDVSKWTR